MVPSLEKRLKRHVIGKDHAFFAVAPPGCEALAGQELETLGIKGSVVPGGVEFNGRLQEAYRANLNLRTASRVLMRIHAFRALAFRSLEKAVSQFAWELFVAAGAPPRLHVTTHHCRLHHSDAIAERMAAIIVERLEQAAPAPAAALPGSAPQVFVRGVDDRFVVSVDSSGANLYLRGIKTHPGKAPLRETLAAAALMLAGFTGAQPLLDPMCGAGTFALEAALMAKHIPPGWFREFAFAGWPGFRAARWDYIRRKAAQQTLELERPGIFASDIDPEACRQLGDCLERCALSDAVSVACRDFFELDPRDITDRPGLVALNPPYGRRMGDAAASRELFRAVVAQLASRYVGWKFILVVPAARDLPEIGWPVQAHPFIHGGLQVNVLVGEVAA
jgi:putative N6-adenine-specific DNA methylase